MNYTKKTNLTTIIKAKTMEMILYPINIESAPNWVIRNAFAKAFNPFMEYDWVNIAKYKTLKQTQLELLEIL